MWLKRRWWGNRQKAKQQEPDVDVVKNLKLETTTLFSEGCSVLYIKIDCASGEDLQQRPAKCSYRSTFIIIPAQSPNR